MNNRSKRFVGLFALALIALPLGPTIASAATFKADFNQSTLDPALGFSGAAGYTIASGGGELIMSVDQPSSANQLSSQASVYTNFLVSGDYVATITVDFTDLPDIGSGLYTDADFGTTPNSPPGYYSGISGFHDASYSYVNGFYNVAGVYTSNGNTNAASTDLTYEVERSGDTVTELVAFAGTNVFSEINSRTDPKLVGPSSITFGNVYSGTAGADGDIKFSNFTITTPVSPAPEPSTWALMIAGMAMIGGVIRLGQRRRLRGVLAA